MADSIHLNHEVRQFLPEHARLKEALANANANNSVATLLITVGGAFLSYATFTGSLAEMVANVSAGCLLAGIVVMFWNQRRRRSAG